MRRLTVLIMASAGFALVGCDSKTPVEPASTGLDLLRLVDASSGLTASAVSPTEIDLSWASSPNASGYQIFRSNNGTTGTYSLIATTNAAVTKYANSGLISSTQYCYEIRSFKVAGKNTSYSAYSTAACAATKQGPLDPAPTGVDASPLGSSTVGVVWATSAGTVSGFRVERSAGGTGPWEAAKTTDGSTRSYVDGGRESEKAVCYHVVALYATSESNPSSADCTTPPASPTSLVAVPASDGVTLTWRDNSGVEDQYEVQRSVDGGSFSALTTLPPNSASYRDAAIAVKSTYWYRIQARKDGGVSDNSNTVTITVPSPDQPNPPSDVEVTPARIDYWTDPANSPISVRWKDNSANEDGFRIERANGVAGPWTLETTRVVNTSTLLMSGAREQQVCVRIIAFNAAGASEPSTPDCTTPPANPTNLVAKAQDRQSIVVTWADNSAVEDGYKVFRLNAAGDAFIVVATLPPNTVSYGDASVTIDVRYLYRVQALKDGGVSDFTNDATGVIPSAPPAAPLDLSASYFADNMYGWLYFSSSWTDVSNNAEGFLIEGSADGVGGWQKYATTVAPSLQQKLSLWDGFGPITECYRVSAFNSAGTSPPSKVRCTEWDVPPTNLAATAVDQQSIDLSWTDNGTFEFGYMVFRSTSADGEYDLITETPANATSFHDSGLVSGQEYWYFLASDFGGDSFYDSFNYSNRVSATTLTASGTAQSSRTLINGHLSAIRIRGRPTLEAIQAKYRLRSGSRKASDRSPRRRRK
jgi:fibronectin type 3 domain-containing protein